MNEEVKNDPVDLSSIFGEMSTNLDEDDETTPPDEDAEPEDKGEEIPPKEEDKKDEPEVDWKKRYSDTRRALGEANTKTKTLEAKLTELEKKFDSHDKELFPERQDEETDKTNPEDVAWQEKVLASEELTKTVFKDYDEKVGKQGDEEAPFNKALKENPNLFARVKAAKNPALEAYNIAKEYEFRQNYGSTPEEIEAKIREKVLKEFKEQRTTEEEPVKKTKKATTLRDVEGGDDKTPDDSVEKLPLTSIFRGR